MKLKLLIATLVFAAANPLAGQIRYGFKTGLNFAKMDGPSAKDAAGADVEEWKNVTGFHIGMTFNQAFTDNFGARGEVLYSKKGTKYTFSSASTGTSFRTFKTADGDFQTTSTNVKYLINTNNSYIDIPVSLYARWRDFEISAGASVGFLVASTGDGSLTYAGKTAKGNAVVDNSTGKEEVQYNLSYNYLRDDAGEAGENSATVPVKIDGKIYDLPKTVGAYYDNAEDYGSLYKTLDVSALFGVRYYMSRALYAEGRLQYGLSDISNNKADVSRTAQDGGKPVFQDDKDRNFVIQVSVGFSF